MCPVRLTEETFQIVLDTRNRVSTELFFSVWKDFSVNQIYKKFNSEVISCLSPFAHSVLILF